MRIKKFKDEELLWEIKFSKTLFLCITKWKLSEFDIKVNYKDLSDSKYRKTPKHIHWIFDIMIKKEHKPGCIKLFAKFLLEKWEELDSEFCSNELKKLHNKEKSLEDLFKKIKEDIENLKKLEDFEEINNFWYFPFEFLALFWYLMILQEKNNRSDAYMFKRMLEGVINDEYNPYKIISIATWKYRK